MGVDSAYADNQLFGHIRVRAPNGDEPQDVDLTGSQPSRQRSETRGRRSRGRGGQPSQAGRLVTPRKRSPGVGDALQRVLAAVDEPETGARCELTRGCTDQNLVRNRPIRDAACDVESDPARTPFNFLELTRVDADSDRDPEPLDTLDECEGVTHRARGTVESGQEAVAGRVELRSPENDELLSRHPLVCGQQNASRAIADPFQGSRRANDVRHDDRSYTAPREAGPRRASVRRRRSDHVVPALAGWLY